MSHGSLPVLVPGADSPTGLGIARALRGEDVAVVGIARDPHAPACRSSAWHDVSGVPDDTPNAWLAAMGAAARRHGRMVLLPACDDAVAVVGAHADALRRDFDLVTSPPEVVTTLLDKTRFHSWAVDHGFRVPSTEIVSDAAGLRSVLARATYPVVLKPHERTAAWQAVSLRHKAFRLESAADVEDVAFDLFAASPRYVVQQWIPGRDSDVYFCLVYRDRDGVELGHRVGRKIVQWPEGTGNTALCVTAEDDELRALTTKLFDEAGMVGLGSLEIKRSSADGQMYITEPTVGRPNLQSGVAVASGVNLVVAAYRDACGLPQQPPTPPAGASWVHESTVGRALVVAAWRGRLDVRAVVGATLARSRRGAAFAARGDLMPLAMELARQVRLLGPPGGPARTIATRRGRR